MAYRLQPGECTLPMQAEQTHQGWDRAGFDGLPKQVQADRPVAAEDLVVWYSFIAHHVVRPED